MLDHRSRLHVYHICVCVYVLLIGCSILEEDDGQPDYLQEVNSACRFQTNIKTLNIANLHQ